MNAGILFASALRSLRQHKVRSLLTTLGIIIGVISIICVMSIGEGAKYRVNKEIEKLGTNFIIALSASQKRLSQRGQPGKPIFTPEDVRAIENEIDDVAMISPGIMLPSKITYEGKVWDTQVGGALDNYLTIREWKLTAGEFFTSQDVRSRNKVVVIGKTILKEVFDNKNPIGKKIRIKKLPFTVIGILEEKGKRPDGADQDDIVMMPITTAIKRLKGGKTKYFALIMAAKSKKRMVYAEQQVRALLRQKHRIPDNQEDDFTIFTQDDISQASEAAARVLNMLLLFVASIALIVGGIGIMNIMLVSVTERTREIGIRMALGATTSNILNQFLLEAITICFCGGALGVILGVTASNIIGMWLGWPIFISQTSVGISLGSSALIGLFFGYYPAYKAAHLNPVEALVER